MRGKITNDEVFQNMLTVWDFYKANPMASAKECADFFGIPPSTARSRTMSLLERGMLKRHFSTNKRHQHPGQFTVADSERPEKLTSRIDLPEKAPGRECNRRIVPAKQIGMTRDALIAAFFGAAGQVSA